MRPGGWESLRGSLPSHSGNMFTTTQWKLPEAPFERRTAFYQHPPTTAQGAVDRHFLKTTVVRKTTVNYFICQMPIV